MSRSGSNSTGHGSSSPTKFSLLRGGSLREDLPHLQHIFDPSPKAHCEISCYDYDQAFNPLTAYHTIYGSEDDGSIDVAEVVIGHSEHTATRVVVVQDISSQLMIELINILDISPEVFEEHLQDCDWTDKHQKIQDSSTWNSRRIKKSHCSMRWYRTYKACLRREFQTMEIRDRSFNVRDLPNLREIDLRTEIPLVKEQRFYAAVSTWRSHLHLHAGIVEWHDQHRNSSEIVHGADLANEERVTVWRGACTSHALVVVLVDAGFAGTCELAETDSEDEGEDRLWQVRDANNGASTIRRGMPSARHDRLQNARTELLSSTNYQPPLFRESSDPEVNTQEPHAAQAEMEEVSDLSPPIPPATSQQSGPIVSIISFDNDPNTTDQSQIGTGTAQGVAHHGEKTSATNDHGPEECNSLNLTSRPHSQQSARPEGPALKFVPPEVFERMSFIRNAASRCPVEFENLDNAQKLGFFKPLTSTREDLGAWLQQSVSLEIQSNAKGDMMTPIFIMFHHDTLDFLRTVERYLDEVISASNNESEVEKYITYWRRMLGYLDQQLREIRRTAPTFAKFLSADQNYTQRERLNDALGNVVGGIDDVRQHLQQAYVLITSSISVAESRRGISEAESVTRLTELAFVYVPLSFAASFFGMQVKELNPETTSIVGFVGLAVAVVSTSYLVRLMIRSQLFVSIKQKMMESVRRDAAISETQTIRTRHFLAWIWHRMITDQLGLTGGADGYHGILVPLFSMISATMVMISVWSNSGVYPSLKLAISVGFLVIFVSLLGLTGTINVGLIQQIARARRRRYQWRQMQRMRNNNPLA